MTQGMNILGIDWGASVVGVALASSETGIALPFGTLKNDPGVFDRLLDIVKKENIQLIVMGFPSHIERAGDTFPGKRFGEELEKRTSLRVLYQNEMFTTKMAQRNLIEQGKKRVGAQDDVEAARIILQEWLDQEENKRFFQGE